MALTVRTDEELENALTELSTMLNTSRQEVIRTAVMELRSQLRHEARVNDAFDHVSDRWASVIERLAST
jgi:predicted transcriptional regulator